MESTLATPRYWLTWIGAGAMWMAARLPMRIQFGLGRMIGTLGHRFAHARRHIARTNIGLCFPQLNDIERDELVRRTFESTGIGAVETAVAWFGNLERYYARTSIEGLELLTERQRRGRGVLLVGAHFSTLDLAGALLSRATDFDVIYRYNKNPVIEYVMRRGRARHFAGMIERSDPRRILRSLKQGRTVWYAADQDYGPKVSAFVPFFGVPAATITATARFARANASSVLFISHFRDPNAQTWSLHIRDVSGFPSDDEEKDARHMNSIIESAIRPRPDQYLWLHRRFKTRPPGELRPY